MSSIITYLILYNQYLLKQISQLLLFIAKNIPLKQWAFDDSRSPKYQKFKVDKLPIIKVFEKQDYTFLLEYYLWKYGKPLKPIHPHKGKPRTIPDDIICPRCNAPHQFIYDNNGNNGQFQCKACGHTFVNVQKVTSPISLACPYCSHALSPTKDRKHFRIHKCINPKCSYYLKQFSKLPKDLPASDRYKYKLHYIYREFVIDFFKMDLHSLSKNATSFSFKKFNSHSMGLCLTYHVNLQLSSRKTAQALFDIHGISISHTMVTNYAMTAAAVIKPFTDTFNYNPSNILSADETYIKVKGIRHYVWIIMDACKKSILGYQVSMSRDVGPCILTMRSAFEKFKDFPGKLLKFISDGYSAYPLAAQQFHLHKNKTFDVTQVIGLTNDDAVSKEYRWVKQVVERLNRTFKSSYRTTCGYGSENGALYSISLWVAYYNFLRPHPYNYWRPLNYVDELVNAENMPAKWQLLIFLGQETIAKMQETNTAGSVCT
jgi:transposase-like protein